MPTPTLTALTAKTAVVHTVTYTVVGALAASALDYASAFARPEMACWMRPITDHVVMAGPIFQPLRGILFALVLFPVRSAVFGRPGGWLVLWWLLVGLGVIGTFGPAPGSLEGLVFTVIPPLNQFTGYLEVVPQAGLLAALLVYWVDHPEKRWLTRVLVALFLLAVGLPILGLLAASGNA